jgi:hypothetical protein
MWSRLDFDITNLFYEGLDKVNKDVLTSSKTTFADLQMAGGQSLIAVVKLLRELGFDDDNIRGRVFGFSENGLYLSIVKEQLKDYPITIMEYDENMKKTFDVILGNPPYNWSDGENQRRNNRENLWTRFVFKGWDMLNKNGHLLMVTPKSWMSPSADFGKRKIYKELFIDGNPIYVNIDECKKHFNVGSTFSFYVVQKSTNSKKSQVKTENSEFDFDFTSVDSLPVNISDTIVAIITKFFSVEKKFKFNQSGISTRNEEFYSESHNEYVNPTYHTNSKTLVYSRHISQEMGIPKILICLSGMYKPMLDSDGVISQTNMSCVYKIKNGENINNYNVLLNHKLYKYIMNTLFKYNGWVNMNIVKRLPKIDVNNDLTNDDVYKLFNLNEDEIKHIESNVE